MVPRVVLMSGLGFFVTRSDRRTDNRVRRSPYSHKGNIGESELDYSSRARQEKTVNAGYAIIWMGSTPDRRLRIGETLCWGRYRLGLLSVTFSPQGWWLNVQSGQCDAG